MALADFSTLSAPERLARIIEGLCKAVAARGVSGRITSALMMLLWNRLSRAALRARSLGARMAAGKSLVQRRRRAATPRPARTPPPHLPRGFAWMIRWAPGTAACGSQLQSLLTDPGMAALATTAPMRRLLRPLCHMLGVPPPPIPKRLPTTAEPPADAPRAPPAQEPARDHRPRPAPRTRPPAPRHNFVAE